MSEAPVGWMPGFATLGALSGMWINGVSAVDPSLHHHAGAAAGIGHALLFALPLAFLLGVLLRLRERALLAGVAWALAGAALGVVF